MIYETDIVSAISKQIKTKFKKPVYTRNTKEGFKEECFFIETPDPQVGSIGTEMREMDLSVRVTWFPLGRYPQKDLWNVRKDLEELFFLGLKVNDDFYISYEEPLNFTQTSAGNLEMLMSLHYIEDLPEEDGEMLEELDTSIKEE